MGLDLALAQRDELIKALLGCKTLQTADGRLNLLDDLRETFPDQVSGIKEAAASKTHIRNIVMAFARSGDWISLIERAQFNEGETSLAAQELGVTRLELEQNLFSGDDLQRLRKVLHPVRLDATKQRDLLEAFHRCARKLNVDPVEESEDPYRLLLTLASFPLQDTVPALQFALEIKPLIPQPAGAALSKLVKEMANRMNVKLRAPMQTGTPFVLLFEMRPKGEGFVLRANLRDADGEWIPLSGHDDPVPESAVPQKFREFVAQAERKSTRLVIEMALPRELLSSPVEQWKIAVGDFAAAVGAQYPLVLRWVKRLDNPDLEPRWLEKWSSIEEHSGQPLWFTHCDQYQHEQLLAILSASAEQGAYISFAFPPVANGVPAADTLLVALNAGTPVAVWCRECDANPASTQQELQGLLQLEHLTQLPALLREIRNRAAQQVDPKHPGHRLVVLFDDPNHRPPQLPGSPLRSAGQR